MCRLPALVTALPDTVTAAALSAGSLGAFAPPPGLDRLLIACDRDTEGQCAAARLCHRCTRLGIHTVVIVPEGGDFNNDLLALGPQRLAARLAPLASSNRTRHRCGEDADAKRIEEQSVSKKYIPS